MGAGNDPKTGGVDFDVVLADSAKINNQLKVLWLSCGTEDLNEVAPPLFPDREDVAENVQLSNAVTDGFRDRDSHWNGLVRKCFRPIQDFVTLPQALNPEWIRTEQGFNLRFAVCAHDPQPSNWRRVRFRS